MWMNSAVLHIRIVLCPPRDLEIYALAVTCIEARALTVVGNIANDPTKYK